MKSALTLGDVKLDGSVAFYVSVHLFKLAKSTFISDRIPKADEQLLLCLFIEFARSFGGR